ncbi:MAG TPA: flavodoxin domain-containing protein, partial [Motiliproteus sp.]
PQLQPLLDEPPDLLLVCTSTTGQGELPDNLLPFFSQLQTQQPSLAGQRVAVVGLGDAAYDETFAMGGKLFEAELLTRQAEPLLELLILDAAAADDPFARSAEWCERLLQRL